MSTYYIKAIHKSSGEVHDVLCVDDYFGRRDYGYFPQVYRPKATPMNEEEFLRQYDICKKGGE